MLRFFRRSDEQTREKTEAAVQKSRGAWFGRIMGILRSSDLDESLWERLEEILISGDVGVDTSFAIIGGLRKRAQNESILQTEDVFSSLKEEMVSFLA